MDEAFASEQGMIHFNWDLTPMTGGSEKETKRKTGRHMGETKSVFWRDHKIAIIAAAIFTIYSLLLIWRVDARAVKRVRTEELVPVQEELVKTQEKLKKYTDKEEEQTRQYFLSGEASKEAQRGRDANALAHDGGVWKNEAAFKGYCWNVWLRSQSSLYPDTIEAVLSQPFQYDYYAPEKTYETQKEIWALEVLQQAEVDKKLPAYLTENHLHLEMKDGGATCVLHTDDKFYSKKDDPWRLMG